MERYRDGQLLLHLLEEAPETVVGLPDGGGGNEDVNGKKSVGFSAATRVAYVDHLSDLSDEAFDSLYNRPQDLKRIEAGMISSIRAYRSGRITLDGAGPQVSDEEDTVRGLEHVVSAQELRRRKAWKERAVGAVLAQQSRMRMTAASGPPAEEDNEVLAREYAHATAPARDLAAENGRKDALYVQLHVRVAAAHPKPQPRPIIKKVNSVSKGVLARLGAGGVGGDPPPPQQQQTQQRSLSEGDLVAILDHALDLGAAPPAQAQPLPRQGLTRAQSQHTRISRDTTLWASLSGEAVVAFPSTAAPPLPPSSTGSGTAQLPSKIARDALERISLSLQAEKVDPKAPLPVAVPIPTPPVRNSNALTDMLSRACMD